jgi:hypothetical protein
MPSKPDSRPPGSRHFGDGEKFRYNPGTGLHFLSRLHLYSGNPLAPGAPVVVVFKENP